MKKIITFLLTLLFLLITQEAFPQDNYEIQVYGSETVAPKATMVELHSNYTTDGSISEENGVLPTHHIVHETIEITHGFTNWFEVGFYFFNAIGNEGRTNYVGSHIRPRVRVPDSWHWPVGVSLSLENVQESRKEWVILMCEREGKKNGNNNDWSQRLSGGTA